MKKIVQLITLGLILTSCGTSKPLKDHTNNLVPGNLSLAQVERSILKAGVTRGWIMTKEKNKKDTILASLTVRTHSAQVLIPYSTTAYSLLYKTSSNLNYNLQKNSIHRSYLRWLLNLKQEIDRELLSQPLQ